MGLLELLIAMVVPTSGSSRSSASSTARRSRSHARPRSPRRARSPTSRWRSTGASRTARSSSRRGERDPRPSPAAGSGSPYQADTSAYTNSGQTDASRHLDKSTSTARAQVAAARGRPRSTQVANTAWNFDIPSSCVPSAELTPPHSDALPTQATQTLPGPGRKLVPRLHVHHHHPADGHGRHVHRHVGEAKQVTVVVRDPRNSAKILARETSDFAPIEANGLLG